MVIFKSGPLAHDSVCGREILQRRRWRRGDVLLSGESVAEDIDIDPSGVAIFIVARPESC
jgi:hypothetical protein